MSLPHARWNRKDEGERESSLSDSRRWFRSHHFPAAHFDHVDTGNLDVFRALPQLFLGLRTSSLASEERRWGFICMGKCMESCPFDTTSSYPPPTVEGAAAPVLIYWFWFLDPTVRFRSDDEAAHKRDLRIWNLCGG